MTARIDARGEHAAAFSLWMLVMLAQTLLIGGGRTDLHERLGIVAAVLAAPPENDYAPGPTQG